ncbi:fumarylacetoacetate hydrolase family protein [Bacillus massilioanorexius]|uniref:fumarylacetoacetate hydrolase family protein n=2 Tax=Bacillus TaxID=1386 RepID=UPI001FE8BC07|nr:fumarylacetoacetate hydrolase family protein [Bacillus massilioanorexius]
MGWWKRMISVTFYKDKRLVLGIKTEKGILDVEAASTKFPYINNIPLSVYDLINIEDMHEEISKLVAASLREETLFLEETSLDYGPSVPEPKKIICIGLNYKKHATECNLPFPSNPIIFSKFNNTINAHDKEIMLPHTSSQVDYEAELAIIIGKKARNVKKEDALSVIYGYCIANDISARDLQSQSSQWLLGKTSDGFCPIGPYLVSKDEIEDPDDLNITSYVNGEIRQKSNTSDMIFSCRELITYISEYFTLQPGDVILTGTPEGVILGYPEEKRVWLKDGDVVKVTIDKLGTLSNIFIQNTRE